MSKANKNTAYNIFAVLIGALLMGLLWRVRGTTGWGSSWGLLNAGFVFTMFLILAGGARQKMNAGWLGLTSLSFMLTVPAWGTLLGQITGVLVDEALIDTQKFVSIPSAVFQMLCLGFGVAVIFGIMLGRAYSSKQWKLLDFIIVIAIFYAVDLITKATVSHWVLDAIQPQAAELFEEGLALAGKEGTAYEAYMSHFADVSWGKKIAGGRNYFSAVQTISSAFRAIAAIVATRFIVKDKIAAKTGLVTSAAFAFSITVSDLFFYFGDGGYHELNAPYFPESVAPWSCWEFFTGFIAGGIITAFVLFIKKEEDVPEITFAKIPEKATTVLTFIMGYVFLIGVNIVRPILERYDDSDYQIAFIIGAVLVAGAVIALVVKKLGFKAEIADMTVYSKILLPVFIVFIVITYMFLAIPEDRNYVEIGSVHNILVVVSAVAVLLWWAKSSLKAK